MFTPLARAFGQLGDPALLGVLVGSLILSAACFAGIGEGSAILIHGWLALHTGAGWLANAVGAIVAALAAFWLFLPVAMVIASLFQEPVCRAVERRWYPGLPPARGASLLSGLWDGLAIGLRVFVLTLLTLALGLVLPGIGHVLGLAVTAWAIGRGLFSAVAMRRMTRGEAMTAYSAVRGEVLIQGILLAVAGTIPFLNLLVPVLGPAIMVHVLADARRPVESWG